MFFKAAVKMSCLLSLPFVDFASQIRVISYFDLDVFYRMINADIFSVGSLCFVWFSITLL